MMPLIMAKSEETVTIRKISRKDEVCQYLSKPGFVVDSDVTVVSEIVGNLIVQVVETAAAATKTSNQQNTARRRGGGKLSMPLFISGGRCCVAELRESHLRYLLAIYELSRNDPDVGIQAVAGALN